MHRKHDSNVNGHEPMRDVEESAGFVVVDVTMKQLSAVFGLLADLFCADVDNRSKENESDNVA